MKHRNLRSTRNVKNNKLTPKSRKGRTNMVYRAKITKIQAWVEDHYSVTAYNYVKDANDRYIEVKDPDEAELLESMNSLEQKRLALARQWYEKYE